METEQEARLVAFLIAEDGIRHWPVRLGRAVVGRAPTANIRLDAPGVSGEHAALLGREGRDGLAVLVKDLGSVNGTLVNGDDLLGDLRLLRDGDTVRFGDVACRVRTVS
jgi:pSer/pThr/pTyr-binding forkhead associated (FHA) protein